MTPGLSLDEPAIVSGPQRASCGPEQCHTGLPTVGTMEAGLTLLSGDPNAADTDQESDSEGRGPDHALSEQVSHRTIPFTGRRTPPLSNP